MLYSYACSYKARDEARVEGDAEYIPNKLQFSQSGPPLGPPGGRGGVPAQGHPIVTLGFTEHFALY